MLKIWGNSLGLLYPNKYVMDLSNMVLNIDSGQGAAKISGQSWRSQKESADLADPRHIGSNWAKLTDISTSIEKSMSYLFGARSPRVFNYS